MYRDLIEYVVKAMVDHPDEVVVSERRQGSSVQVEIRVHESDMGRVIGKRGRVVNALRTLVEILGSKYDTRVSLEVESK
jgi:predicted RNA-binding protein YlqC (UPF0109 family)